MENTLTPELSAIPPLPPATCSALETEVRNILGYPDGDILSMVRRYHAYATNQITTLRRGGERVAAYCQKLQEQLPQETVMKLGLAAVQAPNDKS